MSGINFKSKKFSLKVRDKKVCILNLIIILKFDYWYVCAGAGVDIEPSVWVQINPVKMVDSIIIH